MKRPISPYVFGVLNIGFGGLTFLGLIGIVLLYATGNAEPGVFDAHWLLKAWDVLTNVTSLLAAMCLLASGIGLLMVREWARRLAIYYALYSLFASAFTLALLVAFLPIIQRELPHEEVLIEVSGLAIGFALSSFYDLFALFFLTRPRVKLAFANRDLFARDRLGENPFARETDVAHSPVSENPFAPPPRS